MANIKISQLPAKGAILASTDLVEISEFNGSGYVSKSITGQEIIDGVSGGGVTDVTATAPISSSGGSTPDISIPQASTIDDGYLSSIDFSTFNAKQDELISGTNIKSLNGASLLGSGGLSVQPTLVSGTNIKTIEGQSILGSGNIDLSKSDVGLGNVDNTSDANKPVSTAQQTALNAKQDTLVSGTNIKSINGSSVLGSGNLVISGGVTSVTGTSPIVSSGGATPAISISTANTTTTGALTSTDWNTFNGKQNTLVSGTSIKTVNSTSLLGSGDVSVGVTSVTGTSPITSSGGATPAISIATSNTTTTGALTSTDWNTFNNKQAALVSGTNIKTINSTTILGSGNLAVQPTLVSGTNIKTINGNSVLGSGNITISGGGTNPTSTYIPVNSSGTFVDSKLYQQNLFPSADLINTTNVYGVNFNDFSGNTMLCLFGSNGLNTIGSNNTTFSIGIDTFASAMRVGTGIIVSGTHVSISKWIKVNDENGTAYYIPLYL